MSVVGIDFGNLNTVVAVARNRGIDVIVNETSNRATPSLVSLTDKQRFLGEGAKNQEISNFKNTISGLKRLIGRSFQDPEVQKVEKPFINARLSEASARSEVVACVNYLGEEREFTFTQLASMFLVKVKEFTAAELKAPVTDCVISCPVWFTDIQRRALLDAARVAGLNCLRLLNDTTASALGYGITKTDLPEPSENKPKHVCFVDLGHSSYQVSIVSFEKGKLVVKGTACDRNLGGRDYDQVLAKHYTEEFSKKYKIDINSNAKAKFRLLQACERVKKILSANPLAMLNVECLMDDKDVSAQVKREEFLEWAAPISNRLIQPIEQALAASGLTADDIECVELVGGSTRLPIVKETLAKFFGGSLEGPNKLSTTLNLDEAVARGCALQCAIISPVFKVRPFNVQDWNNLGINLHWDATQMPAPKADEQQITEMEAFPVTNIVPSSKILTFFRDLKHDELAQNNGSVNLVINASYINESDLPLGVSKNIGHWVIKGIKQLASTETKDADGNVVSAKATIKVKAKLDGNGLVSLESANQIEEITTVVEEEAAKETAKEESKEAKEPKTKKVLKRHDLEILPHLNCASKELFEQWYNEEGAMHASDRLVIDTAEKRNALEEYVYNTRSKLEMAWSEYVIETDSTKFSKALTEMEDWLYGEGEDATKSVFVEKLSQLKVIGDPIEFRYSQSEERIHAEKAFKDYASSVIVRAQSGEESLAHIEKEELDKIVNQARSKVEWLNEQLAKQNERAKHDDPVITSKQIAAEKDALYYYCTPIFNKPKPKVEKKAEAEEKKETPSEEMKDQEMKEEGADEIQLEEIPTEEEKMQLD